MTEEEKQLVASIPVKVEVDEDNKSATVIIPWDRLAVLEGNLFREWLAKAQAVRQE